MYMPMIYEDNTVQDTFKLYYVKKTDPWKFYLARTIDFGITWTDTVSVTAPSNESIISVPDSTSMILAFGKWLNGKSYMSKAESTDGGFNFFNSDSIMELGEDKSFIWNTDEQEYWGYVRPYPVEDDCLCYTHNCYTLGNGVRKIALMKNGGSFGYSNDWSARNIILEVDTSDYVNSASPDYRTQIYYMQVFRNGDDWWGLIGMYRVGNNGGVTNDYPYTHPEYTVDVELVWSDDGEDWHRTNNSQPFLAFHDSINMIFAMGTVIGDSVYFISAESTRLHATYTLNGCGHRDSLETSAFAGKYFNIFLSKISIEKLNEWRPPTEVNVTVAIEGFLNTGTGKHNIRDTLPAELRSSTSPYGIVASATSVIDSVTLIAEYDFPHVNPGVYYLVLSGRNSIETWSATDSISITNGTVKTYDFTASANRAFGFNLVLKEGKYCVYSGDVNKDGSIDITDVSQIQSDADNYVTGYVVTDLNSDFQTDITDASIADNNASNFVMVVSP